MVHIPQSVLAGCNTLPELHLRGRGKVRDTYNILEQSMLVRASNRCSIFDLVLPVEIPQKGEVLTALNHYWVNDVIGDLFQTDMIACGAGIDDYLPESLRSQPDLQKQGTVVKIFPAPDVEDIVRIILTGSGWASYQKNRQVCGHKLPAGLNNGSLLPYPIYTPTTKAEVGHDEHITADSVADRYGVRRERTALQLASLMANYAASRGLIMADTKFEFSIDPVTGLPVLVDEKGTPDSSRFVDRKAWEKASKKGQFPASLDKQYVREWGKQVGIDKLDPQNPEHLEQVDRMTVPAYVVKMTNLIYRHVFWRLTGDKLELYQRESLGIKVDVPKLHIEVVVGSRSDLPQISSGLEEITRAGNTYNVNVLSCHRNAGELPDFVRNVLTKADRVIGAAGKAAAQPGIIKSYMSLFGCDYIPVIGVALKGETPEDDRDATGSIKGLPGQPVELDKNGEAYFGAEGFLNACYAASNDEFLPKTVEHKPAEIAISIP